MPNENNLGTISLMDQMIEQMYKFCVKNSAWSGIAGAFLTGLFVNVWSDPSIHDLPQLLNRIFNFSERPINILSWLAIFIMIFLTLGKFLLGKYLNRQSFGIRIAKLFEENVTGPAAAYQFHKGRITWGPTITLQSCPDLRNGWFIKNVEITHLTKFHTLPTDIEPSYVDYLKSEFYKKFNDDRTRLMLTKNPVAFTDNPTLRIEVMQTKWSQIQYFKTKILDKSHEIYKYIVDIIDGPITVPNSLALLLVVATSDGYVLLTRTSKKVVYSPNLWACSIGEHLDLEDFKGPGKYIALNWLNRALSEELCIEANDYTPENARIMALVLETELVNCSLIGVVELNINRAELDSRINKGIRPDYEASDWEYITWGGLAGELMKPSRSYHPSTGLRMLYAGIYKYGAANFSRQLLSLRRK